MNQILITEKIYVTPELKRKKKMYKVLFMISILIIMSLFSMYLYAEYDRNKSEGISKDILLALDKEDDTLVSTEENALVVLLTQDTAEYDIEDLTEQTNTSTNNQANVSTATSLYTAPNGKTYESIGRIVIPKIGVDYPIFSKSTDEWLKVSICKFHGGNINEVGNLCLVGHNYRNKRFFSKVPTLQMGDIIQITDLSNRTIEYEVYDMHTVYPNNRDDTTQYTNGKKEVTLITCTDDSTQRVIVKCTEKK